MLQRGAEPLDEVLVGVRRVELDQTDSFRRAGETSRQLPRDEGLARPGRPLKDDLTLVVEQLLDRPQVRDVEEQRLGERPQVGRGLTSRRFVRFAFGLGGVVLRRITLDPPDHRLRFEAVAGPVQSPLRRLFDDPVEETQHVLVQRPLVLIARKLAVTDARAGVVELRRLERRIPLGVQCHQQDRDRPQPDSSAADHATWPSAGERANPRDHFIIRRRRRSVVPCPERSHRFRPVIGSEPLQQRAHRSKITVKVEILGSRRDRDRPGMRERLLAITLELLFCRSLSRQFNLIQHSAGEVAPREPYVLVPRNRFSHATSPPPSLSIIPWRTARTPQPDPRSNGVRSLLRRWPADHPKQHPPRRPPLVRGSWNR